MRHMTNNFFLLLFVIRNIYLNKRFAHLCFTHTSYLRMYYRIHSLSRIPTLTITGIFYLLKRNTVYTGYKLVSTMRCTPGNYPHHFLKSFGREWENPRTSERLFRFLSLAFGFSHSSHLPHGIVSTTRRAVRPPPAPFVELITSPYSISFHNCTLHVD